MFLRSPLLLGVLSVVGLLAAAGCSPPPVTDMPDGAPGSTFAYKEAPMLAALVNDGKLPDLQS